MRAQGVAKDVARAVFSALLIEAVKVLAVHYGKRLFPEDGPAPAPEARVRRRAARRAPAGKKRGTP